MLRRRVIARNIDILVKKKAEINDFRFHFIELEKEYLIKYNESSKKEMMTIKNKNHWIRMQKKKIEINTTLTHFFQEGH